MPELLTLLIVAALCLGMWFYVTSKAKADRQRRIDAAWKRHEDEELRKKLVMESHWIYPDRKEAHGTTTDRDPHGSTGSLGDSRMATGQAVETGGNDDKSN